MNEVWLVTGVSSGFGRAITEAAVAAGDIAVAAARRAAPLDDPVAAHPYQVEALPLVVTDIAASDPRSTAWPSGTAASMSWSATPDEDGGAIEETTDAELRHLMDLHFFGPAALIRAALPHMRHRGSGPVVQLTSVGGRYTFAGVGAYCGTKFAREGLSPRPWPSRSPRTEYGC
ncbi:SDR family NAD(P)-dependent oxidoreductase [Streptomyces sp. NPDC006552]|uniref:SDR family NAD(P)-dependent oxidoreductase n=1 Tax=Streptomyces sp. NPDC006552 TaxID=3157179 RepID=UPI00339EFBA5